MHVFTFTDEVCIILYVRMYIFANTTSPTLLVMPRYKGEKEKAKHIEKGTNGENKQGTKKAFDSLK